MLSVFMTPCTKPTRVQCATISAVRRHTSSNQRRRRSPTSPSISAAIAQLEQAAQIQINLAVGQPAKEALAAAALMPIEIDHDFAEALFLLQRNTAAFLLQGDFVQPDRLGRRGRGLNHGRRGRRRAR